MPLRRSESTRTTLSMFLQRSTKYQKWLGIVNVLLLLGGIVLIFAGLWLKLAYYMDQLGMVDNNFLILPWVLVGSGVLSFLIAAGGFIFSSTVEAPSRFKLRFRYHLQSRFLLFFYAVCCIVLSLVQFSSIYVSFEARRVIGDENTWSSTNFYMEKYYTDDATKEKWDFLQSRLRCCGQEDYEDYTSIVKRPDGIKTLFPDSCCYDYGVDRSGAKCSGAFTINNQKANQRIEISKRAYVRGCLDILSSLYEAHLEDFLLYCSLVCCLYALILIVGATLAFAFAAQINRHRKRESEWKPGSIVGAGFSTLGPEGTGSPDGTSGGNIALNDLPRDHQL